MLSGIKQIFSTSKLKKPSKKFLVDVNKLYISVLNNLFIVVGKNYITTTYSRKNFLKVIKNRYISHPRYKKKRARDQEEYDDRMNKVINDFYKYKGEELLFKMCLEEKKLCWKHRRQKDHKKLTEYFFSDNFINKLKTIDEKWSKNVITHIIENKEEIMKTVENILKETEQKQKEDKSFFVQEGGLKLFNQRGGVTTELGDIDKEISSFLDFEDLLKVQSIKKEDEKKNKKKKKEGLVKTDLGDVIDSRYFKYRKTILELSKKNLRREDVERVFKIAKLFESRKIDITNPDVQALLTKKKEVNPQIYLTNLAKILPGIEEGYSKYELMIFLLNETVDYIINDKNGKNILEREDEIYKFIKINLINAADLFNNINRKIARAKRYEDEVDERLYDLKTKLKIPYDRLSSLITM